MRDDENPPAITRKYSDIDADVEVRSTPYDTVSFTRGLGDTGYRIEVVDHECPACGFDRMVRMHRVNPEDHDSVTYWCLYPNCGHYLANELSYAFHGNYPQRKVRGPTITDGDS